MKDIQLKEKLRKKNLTIGSWVTIGHQAIVDILAEAGFEWLTIDLEHTAIDYDEMQVLIGFIQARNMAALVRVSKNEEVVIKRVLDAGADGIIVPMVNFGEDVRNIIEYTKYPPVGKRGVGLNRAQRYGFGFGEYMEWLADHIVIIAQIEHIDAVNNLEDILSSDELDGILVGPYDLSGSLGIPGQFNEKAMKDALAKIETMCRQKNISIGYHIIDPDANIIIEKQKAGYNFIVFSTDFLFMGNKARDEMNFFQSFNQLR